MPCLHSKHLGIFLEAGGSPSTLQKYMSDNLHTDIRIWKTVIAVLKPVATSFECGTCPLCPPSCTWMWVQGLIRHLHGGALS